MDPLTLATIGLSLFGGVMKASAAQRAAAAQAQQDRGNARLAALAASDAVSRGSIAEGGIDRRTSEAVSTDQSSLAASGVSTNSGSALSTLAAQRAQGAFAAIVARNNAAKEAWGYETQSQNFESRATYALQSGDSQASADILGGLTSALGGAQKGGLFSNAGSPGITTPLIRVGEPTFPEAFMGNPLAGYSDQEPPTQVMP